MRYATLTGLAALFLVVAGESLFAQFPMSTPYGGFNNRRATAPRRPSVSPYLNLLGGRGVGNEYYNRVRPQQEFRKQNAAMGRSIQQLQQATAAQGQQLMDYEMGATGHVTSFMNHMQYFNVSTSQQGMNSVRRAAAPALKGAAR